jgi:hypothetical protein
MKAALRRLQRLEKLKGGKKTEFLDLSARGPFQNGTQNQNSCRAERSQREPRVHN